MTSRHSLCRRITSLEARRRELRTPHKEGDPFRILLDRLPWRQPTYRREDRGTYYVVITDDPGVPYEPLILAMADRIAAGTSTSEDAGILAAMRPECPANTMPEEYVFALRKVIHDFL